MYSPEGRTARTPGSVKLTVAAVSIALMGTAGVALAAPKADPGPPEQAQGNGPPPQAQQNGPPPQAQAPAQAPARAKAKVRQGAGEPAAAPPAQAPPAGGESNPGSGGGQSRLGGGGHHGRPAAGEVRGQGQTRSNVRRASGCQAARCSGGSAEPSAGASEGGDEQPQPAGGQHGPTHGDLLGVSEERPDDPHGGAESGAVEGLNQAGGEDVSYAPRGSFDGALPFTGFELALLAAIGALLALAGAWLRRSTA